MVPAGQGDVLSAECKGGKACHWPLVGSVHVTWLVREVWALTEALQPRTPTCSSWCYACRHILANVNSLYLVTFKLLVFLQTPQDQDMSPSYYRLSPPLKTIDP